jgi:hypothetical protein
LRVEVDFQQTGRGLSKKAELFKEINIKNISKIFEDIEEPFCGHKDNILTHALYNLLIIGGNEEEKFENV